MTAGELERETAPPTPPSGRGVWRTLEAALLTLEPGDILTYEAMAELYGERAADEQAMRRIYGRLRTAAKHVLDQHQRVFHIVRGVGYKRAKVEGIMAQVQQHQTRAIREVHTATVKIGTVDPEALSPAMASHVRAARDSLASQLLLMRSRDVRRKDLESVVAAATMPRQLPGMPRAALDTRSPGGPPVTPGLPRALMEQDFPAV